MKGLRAITVSTYGGFDDENAAATPASYHHFFDDFYLPMFLIISFIVACPADGGHISPTSPTFSDIRRREDGRLFRCASGAFKAPTPCSAIGITTASRRADDARDADEGDFSFFRFGGSRAAKDAHADTRQ